MWSFSLQDPSVSMCLCVATLARGGRQHCQEDHGRPSTLPPPPFSRQVAALRTVNFTEFKADVLECWKSIKKQ